MASNKNQHFVPRCYLKPFSHNEEGVAVNLFNVDRQIAVPKAPLKSQCAKPYFYGEDLVVERGVQPIEGAYADLIRRVVAPQYAISGSDRELLLGFWCLQHLRTESASLRAVEMSSDMEKLAGLGERNIKMTIREAVMASMAALGDASRATEDLKVCLVRNETELPFFVCDDPAILTNRWHFQSPKANHQAPGIHSGGAQLILPLTPTILMLAYDGDVYTLPNNNGWVYANRISDISAFNEHQFLNCRANIYFSKWGDREQVGQMFAGASNRRPEARHRLHYAVFDHSEDGNEVFRVIDPAEAREHERAIIHTEAVFPRPSHWPSQTTLKGNGRTYTDGSGIGFVRKAHIPDGDRRQFRKVLTKDRPFARV